MQRLLLKTYSHALHFNVFVMFCFYALAFASTVFVDVTTGELHRGDYTAQSFDRGLLMMTDLKPVGSRCGPAKSIQGPMGVRESR